MSFILHSFFINRTIFFRANCFYACRIERGKNDYQRSVLGNWLWMNRKSFKQQKNSPIKICTNPRNSYFTCLAFFLFVCLSNRAFFLLFLLSVRMLSIRIFIFNFQNQMGTQKKTPATLSSIKPMSLVCGRMRSACHFLLWLDINHK